MNTPLPLLRRDFLRHSLIAGTAWSIARGGRAAPAARPRIGLSQYSLRPLLDAGELDPLDYPAFARRTFGLTELDVWEGALPKGRLDDAKYLGELKRRATDAGTNLFLLMTRVIDAAAPDSAARLARAKTHFPAFDRAAALGCQYLRFFLRAPKLERAAAFEPCLEVLRLLSERAKTYGLKVILEPGSSELTQQGDFLAELMTRLRLPECCLMPDFGKMRGDIYEGTRMMMPYTEVVSAKMHEFDAAGNQVEFDYVRLMKIVTQAGFRGVIAIEWEGKGLDSVAGVRASQRLIERALAAV